MHLIERNAHNLSVCNSNNNSNIINEWILTKVAEDFCSLQLDPTGNMFYFRFNCGEKRDVEEEEEEELSDPSQLYAKSRDCR